MVNSGLEIDIVREEESDYMMLFPREVVIYKSIKRLDEMVERLREDRPSE